MIHNNHQSVSQYNLFCSKPFYCSIICICTPRAKCVALCICQINLYGEHKDTLGAYNVHKNANKCMERLLLFKFYTFFSLTVCLETTCLCLGGWHKRETEAVQEILVQPPWSGVCGGQSDLWKCQWWGVLEWTHQGQVKASQPGADTEQHKRLLKGLLSSPLVSQSNLGI